MKVLHVIPGLSPFFGGPTKAVLEMCQELNKQGIRADIATTNADVRGITNIPLEQPVEIAGVTVYCFQSPFLRKYGFSRRLTQWLKQRMIEFDLLHIHAFFSYVTAPVTYYAREYRIPYVLRPTGQLNPWPLRKSALVKNAYLKLIGRKCLRHAAAIHFTSEGEMLAAQRLGIVANAAVIPLGLHPAPEGDPSQKGSFRRKHLLPDHKKLIVFLSRLDPKKGLDRLFPALQILRGHRGDFVIAVAGSGTRKYEATVRNLVLSTGLRELVVFTGFLEGEDKLALFRDADVFVLPSYDENFGLAVVEAMGMGVPVLISNQVGIHREVTEYGAGIVTECDSTEIAAALGKLLDNEPLRRCLGRNGRRLVQERFAWSRIGAELVKLYETILASRAQVVG